MGIPGCKQRSRDNSSETVPASRGQKLKWKIPVNMKTFFCTLIILASTPLLRADNLLQNGDFSDGRAHWQGDGKSAADYAQDNSSANSDPLSSTSDTVSLTSKGLIIQLKESRWTKVSQDFTGDKSAHYVFNMTYKIAPGTTLSDKAEDYKDIPDHVRFEGYEPWHRFDIEVGKFFDTVDSLDQFGGFYEKFAPNLGSNDIQTFTDPGPTVFPPGHNMVTVAFPPGKGIVVILSISVTSN